MSAQPNRRLRTGRHTPTAFSAHSLKRTPRFIHDDSLETAARTMADAAHGWGHHRRDQRWRGASNDKSKPGKLGTVAHRSAGFGSGASRPPASVRWGRNRSQHL